MVQLCQPCSSDSQCGLVAHSSVAPGDHLAALLAGSSLTTHTPAHCSAGFCVPDGAVDPLAACTKILAEQHLERLPLAMAQFSSRKLLQVGNYIGSAICISQRLMLLSVSVYQPFLTLNFV